MKNLIEFQNQFFKYAVNKVVNSLESDNYNEDLSKYDQAEVKLGLEKEQEHTDDPKELSKIVADHLDEDPAYYSKMEKAGFDENINLFQKEFKNELEEGRSKRRWVNTLVREIKSYIINLLKNDIDNLIQNKILFYRKDLFKTKFAKHPIMKFFGNVHIIVKEDTKFGAGGGTYYFRDSKIEIENKSYSVSRGDFAFYIDVPSNVKNFKDIKSNFLKYSTDLSELINHELMHFIDDYKDQVGLSDTPEQDIFYNMPKHLKEKYDYYMEDTEVNAYVEASMRRAKMSRIPFEKALYEHVFIERLRHIFSKSKYFEKIIAIIMYKYMKYAIEKFNSVRESPTANKYFERIKKFVIENNLEKHLHDVKDEEAKKLKKQDKEKRKEEWEKTSTLQEGKTKLSKYWNKRAKSRAKRAGRHFPNNKDKEWALEQEEKSKDLSSSLKKTFEQEIKETEEFTKKITEIINTRKNKMKFKGKDPFVSGITGRAKGFKQKHKGSVKVAPGESFGPLEEEGE